MRNYAAFLRGINVGGHRVKGPELCAVFEKLACTDVSTFRASGNVVFDATAEDEDELARRLEAGLETALGYGVRTFLRSAGEVRAIAAAKPFAPRLVEASDGKLQVWILDDSPPAGARDRVLAHATDADRLAFGTRELYWLPQGNMSDSGLDLKALASELGQQSTMRTMGTIQQIAARHFSE